MKSLCYLILLTSVFLAGSSEVIMDNFFQQELVSMEIEYEQTNESEVEQEVDECSEADGTSSALLLSSGPSALWNLSYSSPVIFPFDIPPEA